MKMDIRDMKVLRFVIQRGKGREKKQKGRAKVDKKRS